MFPQSRSPPSVNSCPDIELPTGPHSTQLVLNAISIFLCIFFSPSQSCSPASSLFHLFPHRPTHSTSKEDCTRPAQRRRRQITLSSQKCSILFFPPLTTLLRSVGSGDRLKSKLPSLDPCPRCATPTGPECKDVVTPRKNLVPDAFFF